MAATKRFNIVITAKNKVISTGILRASSPKRAAEKGIAATPFSKLKRLPPQNVVIRVSNPGNTFTEAGLLSSPTREAARLDSSMGKSSKARVGRGSRKI